MQKITTFSQKGEVKLEINEHLGIKKAVLLARENGLSGRIEILTKTQQNEEWYSCELYLINEKNTIVGEIFPYFEKL